MPRIIIRKLEIIPTFRDFDMMGVVHNSVYLDWFERGRFQVMNDIMPFSDMMKLGVAVAVRQCNYTFEQAVRNDEKLVVITRHKIDETYTGRLEFTHELINEQTKTTHAFCECICVLINSQTGELVRNPPDEIRKRYLQLK